MASINTLFILAALSCCCSLPANGLLPTNSVPSTSSNRDEIDGRLPHDFIPSHYDIEIAPDIYSNEPPFPFTGSVAITVRCDVAMNSLTLNTKFLTISSASIETDVNTPVPAPNPSIISSELIPSADFFTLYFNQVLVVGATYIVRISFAGTLLDPTNRGIYYDYYVDSEGETRYMVATQLESIFARQMFPSFDEPEFKATFSVVVVRKPPMISLSNMNLLRTEVRSDGWVADYYDVSPIMPTYLVCVCIGLFEYVEAEWEGVTTFPIRIYARKEMIYSLDYAAQVAPILQAYFDEETGIPYNLPKMDHIALPSKGGAMENWGLVTYGESTICVDPETSSATNLLTTTAVISHEIAHMWYGNLVTTKWWNDIWLNEGYATNYNYYPNIAIAWQTSEAQQADPRRGTQQFLDIDQRNNSDPIVKDVPTVADGPSVFSGSTYPKGGAMVRMLRALLGDSTFKQGHTNYLNAYSYQPATTDNLLSELTNQAAVDGVTYPDGSPLDVKSVMDAWLNQMGYPLLTVTNAGDGTASVTSQRYFNPRGQTPEITSIYNYQWNVPITIATAETSDWNDIRPSFYINIGENSTTLTGLPNGNDEWFVVNPKQMFFYRVDYDSDTRAALVNQLLANHSVIASESRSQLVDDSFSLARSLVIQETQALEMTRYLSADLQFNAWNVALKSLLYADQIYRNFAWYPSYQSYMSSLLVPVFEITGWVYPGVEEPILDQFLRRDISSTTCYYGDVACRNEARDMYNIYRLRPEINSINPNSLPTALCVGVDEGTVDDWLMVYDQYQARRQSPINNERYAYLYALACTDDAMLLEQYLTYIIQGNYISTRDQTTALNYLVQNDIGNSLVWNYFSNSWTTVPTTISKFAVTRNIVSTWYTEADYVKFNNFVAANPPSSENLRNLFAQMSLLIRQNIDWFDANAAEVEQWLTDNQPSDRASRLAAPMPMLPLAYLSDVSNLYED